MTASEIINGLVNSINNDFEALNFYEALTAFDRNDIAHPLTKTYFVFKLDSNDISYYEDETKQIWQKTKLAILVHVYVSFNDSTIKAYEDCEKVFSYLRNRVNKPMSGYNIGEVTVDKDLRAFKIPCKIYYNFDELIVKNQ
ncbi:MAG: hypothetical protein NC122_09035 [Faecalibacterium sp.]|nr:hypothetical protein [Ruminococcus sp.]MCM1392671.1 hypothetical protein [Ruminococcus sp.]MCM1486339.1 hypothetical protein [Faecalibacterium sp.]